MDKKGKRWISERINASDFPLLFCPSLFPVSGSLHFHPPFLWLSFGLNPTHPSPSIHHTPTSSSPLSSFPRAPLPSKSVALSHPSAGTTSRRCSLDHRGMAFWEQPSYARCITNEFRYLQQSVGAKSASSQSLCFQSIINYLPSHPPTPTSTHILITF